MSNSNAEKIKKPILDLTEAGSATKRNDQQILQLAASGRLRAYIKMPSGAIVFSVDSRELNPEKDSRHLFHVGRLPMPPEEVKRRSILLEVDSKTSETILTIGFAEQREFRFALTTGDNASLQRINAPVPANNRQDEFSMHRSTPFDHVHRRFVAYSLVDIDEIRRTDNWQRAQWLEIIPTNLWFARSDIEKLALDSQPIAESFVKSIPLNIAEHTSQKVIDLRAFAIELLWENATAGTPLPTQQEIARILVERYKFSGKQAKSSAYVIGHASVIFHDGIKPEIRAKHLRGLLECSDHWEKALRDNRNHPRNEDMISDLVKKHGFPQHIAEGIVSVINPVGNKGGRPRKLA